MGTTRIKVIDLSSDVEQIKTSRKRAQTGAISDIKKPLVKEKKPTAGNEPREGEREKQATPPVETQAFQPADLEVFGKIEVGQKPKEGKTSKQKWNQKKGKKYQKAKLSLNQTTLYPLELALELVKKVSFTKFDASIEAHIVVKQKLARGQVLLPYPVKKQQKVLVFASGKLDFAKNGVILGNDKIIEDIETKKLLPKKDFAQIIATPEFMPKLARLGKILGPAGVMPNPKLGTVTEKPQDAVKKFSSGAVEFKTDANSPVIHCVIGKVSQDIGQLKENLQALATAINPQRIQKVYLAPTMGPSVKVDTSTLLSVNPERQSKD